MTVWTLLARLATRNAKQQEHVVLPEPGRSLWTKTYEVVRDELKRIGTPRLGGGTVLAGRWKHRTSVDIDLSIEPSPRRRHRLDKLLLPTSGFRRAMNGLGATGAEALSAHQIVIQFGDAKLDIRMLEAIPRAGEREAAVHGHQATVLSTIQILSGKLARCHQLLHRDAFDIKAANDKAPKSLAAAANMMAPQNASNIITAWENTSGLWAAAAPSHLNTVVKKHSYDPQLLGQETANALRDARYRTVEISTEGRTGVFNAETAGGTRIEVPFTKRTLNGTFEEFGINEYLESHQRGFDDDIVRDIRNACRMGKARETVYKATHQTMPTKTQPKAKLEKSSHNIVNRHERNTAEFAVRGQGLPAGGKPTKGPTDPTPQR